MVDGFRGMVPLVSSGSGRWPAGVEINYLY